MNSTAKKTQAFYLLALLLLNVLLPTLPAFASDQKPKATKRSALKEVTYAKLSPEEKAYIDKLPKRPNVSRLVKFPSVTPEESKKQIAERKVPANVFRIKNLEKSIQRKSALKLLSAGSSGPPSIAELARALKNDPDLIYQYVTNNVDYTPIYGVMKGSFGALVDGEANDFDQAALMVALLREAGFTANFVLGTIKLNATQISNWLGVNTRDASTVDELLANGAIPHEVKKKPDGSLNFVRLTHMWVRANIGGTDYVFDPSFKSYMYQDGVRDLCCKIGYYGPGFISKAQEGATITPISVQNMNKDNIRSQLTTMAGNLISWIRSYNPAATVADIIGGRTIDQYLGQLRQTSLPYQNPGDVPEIFTDIPDSYRTTYQVAFLNGINQSFFSDELYGHRLTVFYNASNVPVLYFDGTAVATGTTPVTPGTFHPAVFRITHFAYGFDNIWVQPLYSLTPVFLGNSWGSSSRAMVDYNQSLLTQALDSGLPATSEPVMGQMLAVNWHTQSSQTGITGGLLGQMNRCRLVGHNYAGIVGFLMPTDSPPGATYTDIGQAITAISSLDKKDKTINATACGLNATLHASAYEAGILQQLQVPPLATGINTAKVIEAANSSSLPIYLATSENWNSTVRPQLTNYSTDTLNAIGASITIPFDPYQAVVPKDGQIAIEEWTGYGYFLQGLDGTPGNNNLGALATITGPGSYSGGQKGKTGSPSGAAEGAGEQKPGKPQPGKPGGDPVDMFRGNFNYVNDDLSIGSGTFPYKLTFQKQYNSAARYNDGPLGKGWTHNFALTTRHNSDGYQVLGEDSPVDAAAAIVELFVTTDLYNDLTKPLNKSVVAALCTCWFVDQISQNTVVVATPDTVKTFVKLPDGSYNPPPKDAGSLTQNLDGSFTYKNPQQQALNYDTSGNLISIVDPAGTQVNLTYTSGKLASIANNTGRSLSLNYSGNRLASVSDGTGRSVSYTVDANANLTTFADANSKNTTFAYSDPGVMTQFFLPAHPGNPALINTYDTLGRIASQADALNNVSNFYFAGLRSEIDDPSGNAHIRYSDQIGNVLRDINALGQETDSLYDGLFRLTTKTLPEGNAFSYTYDSKNNVTSVTSTPKPGSTLLTVKNVFTFDQTFNKVKTATDAIGLTTTYSYDNSTGNLMQIQYPEVSAGIPTRNFTYNTKGQMLTSTDETGIVTQFNYDAGTEKLLSRVEDQGGPGHLNLTTQYGYDAVGNRTSMTDPRGNSTAYVFDPLRRMTQITDPAPFNFVTNLTYDDNGNKTSVQKQTGIPATPWQTFNYGYTLSDKLQTITDPASHVTTYEYDINDRVKSITDAENRKWQYSYDPVSRVQTVTDPANIVCDTRTYTTNGLLASQKDANNNTTEFTYDGLDRKDRVKYPDAKFEQNKSYDPNGNLLTFRTRANKTINYEYDSLYRVTSKFPQGQATVSYSYDLAGRLLSASTPEVPGDPSTGDFQRGYDSAGRFISETYPDGKVVAHELDANGNRTKTTWPDGYYINRNFDQLNRLTDIKLNGATASAAHFDYDQLSRRTGLTLNNGTNTAYSYALNNDLTGLQHNYVGSSVNYTMGYNNVHQINSLNCSDGAYIKHPDAGGTTTFTVNNMNQYTAVGATPYTYSADGCLTKIGTNTLQYDTEKHLTKELQTGSNLTFVYDPILQRQAQVKPNGATSPTRYIYDGMRLIATYNGATNTLLNRFVPGVKADESLIQVAAGGSITYNHTDWLGSIISVSNSTGAVAAQAAFDVFGQGTRITLGGQPFGFTGQIGNGLFADYNYKARYYSPALGRFYQPDPIPSDSHQNLYTYVGNDPINNTDPTGMLVVGGGMRGPFVQPPSPGLGGSGISGGAIGGPNIIMNSGGNSGSGSSDTPGEAGSGSGGDGDDGKSGLGEKGVKGNPSPPEDPSTTKPTNTYNGPVSGEPKGEDSPGEAPRTVKPNGPALFPANSPSNSPNEINGFINTLIKVLDFLRDR
ncbi:MAG: hypothetical protein K2Y32_21530 [Candidatus Obscuribacterales bacterium]|nr:hypothetical protein [Candidatus Obscuribacterales bacterium]